MEKWWKSFVCVQEWANRLEKCIDTQQGWVYYKWVIVIEKFRSDKFTRQHSIFGFRSFPLARNEIAPTLLFDPFLTL